MLQPIFSFLNIVLASNNKRQKSTIRALVNFLKNVQFAVSTVFLLYQSV